MRTQRHHVKTVRRASVIIFFVILVALFAWGTSLVRSQMLSNAQELGTRLARSYAAEASSRLKAFELFVGYGATSVNELLDEGADEDRMQLWFQRYANGMVSVLGEVHVDPYAVIDGDIVAAYPWEGDAGYDYRKTAWYTGALASPGTISATDTYEDAITGGKVVTISIALHGEGNVLAMDIPIDDLGDVAAERSQGGEVGYALFDGAGELIFASGSIHPDEQGYDDFLERLHEGVDDGRLEDSESSIQAPDGTNLSVFYTEMESSRWLSVVTIPTMSLLMDGVSPGYLMLVAACVASLAIALLTFARERKSSAAMHETEETVRILGNTYFAIYRVNYLNKTYVTVKSSPDTAEVMGTSGTFEHFMDVLRTVVDQSTFDNFAESFSAENIRKREQQGVIEFGGRYLRRFGDELRWVSVSSITSDEIGNGEAIICFRNVDNAMREEMQRQELLESALETARQATKRQRIFFSNISHDMRTPLNAIVNLARMLREGKHDAAQEDHYLELLEQAGSQLVTLVNEVLDMSHIQEAEQSVLNLAPVDLVGCVRTSVDLVSAQAAREQKVLTFTADWPEQWVRADSQRLGQVVNNLVSNALKYSHEGARIDVRVSDAGSTGDDGRRTKLFRIEVADTGIGMTKEFLDRIFDPFARETMFAPRGVVGTGLGMPIVKNLVQQMGGDITVASKVGEGSTFTVIVPLELTQAPAVPESSSSENETADDALEQLNGARVLVAEDNETNQLIITAMLEMLGIEVTCVDDGAQAVLAVRDGEPGRFDAVLMDMQMPIMDGCTAAKAIRALDHPDAARLPIIAVTANAFAEDASEARTAGMDGYVTKPIDVAALAQALVSCGVGA